MIYKCPKCGSEIRFWCFSMSTRCDCGKCDADFGNSGNAKDYARLKDSKRWRKISEEPPKEGEEYSYIICRDEGHSMLRVLNICDLFNTAYMPEITEWRPVYEC